MVLFLLGFLKRSFQGRRFQRVSVGFRKRKQNKLHTIQNFNFIKLARLVYLGM